MQDYLHRAVAALFGRVTLRLHGKNTKQVISPPTPGGAASAVRGGFIR
jgi:hypothetical protein